MYEQSLIQAGLSFPQATIYEILVKNGPLKAGKIALKSPFKRGLVYKTLEELIKMGLIEKSEEKQKVAVFSPKHPLELKNLVEKYEQKAKSAKIAINGIIQPIISDFNLVSGRPGVRFFEGKEGVKKALEHIEASFEVNSEIISFVKVLPEEFEKEIKNAVNSFIKKRIKYKVKTRVIAIDTPEGKKLQKEDDKTLRKTCLISDNLVLTDFPGGEIFVYKNEVCSIMLERENYFSFIVQSHGIAQMLKAFFESEWTLLNRD